MVSDTVNQHTKEDHGQNDCTYIMNYGQRTWWYIVRNEVEWLNLLKICAVHLLALWGVYRLLRYGFASYNTLIFTYVLGTYSSLLFECSLLIVKNSF